MLYEKMARSRGCSFYIFEAYKEIGDPLIKTIAEWPVSSDYELRGPDWPLPQEFTSFYHIELAAFLHKLGLRGTHG